MQVKGTSRNAIELLQAPLGIAPKAFDAIDVMWSAHELVSTMIDSEMFRVTDINQSVVAAPAVGMDDGVQGHATANYGLQRAFSAVWHHFCVDAAVAFEDAKDDRLAGGATAALATHSARPEVAFIHFNFAARVRRGALAFGSHALSDSEKDHGDGLTRQSGQLRHIAGRKIHREVAHDLTEFTLGNFRPLIIAVY